jgi:hypothetical protein
VSPILSRLRQFFFFLWCRIPWSIFTSCSCLEPATDAYQLNGSLTTKRGGKSSRNPQPLALDEAWLEDLLQRGQIQFPEGRVERGGVKHAICQPRWHWSHNNMVAAPFFSPHTKQGRPSGTTASSGCTEPSIGRWHGAQFFEWMKTPKLHPFDVAWHSMPRHVTGRTLGKRYGMEQSAIGNIVKTWGTSLGTYGNTRQKTPSSHPSPKEKKSSLVYVQSSHWLHAYYILNMVLREDHVICNDLARGHCILWCKIGFHIRAPFSTMENYVS